MDERTAKALEASIKHWEENAAATDPASASVGPKNCALCALFRPNWDDECTGCPVAKATGLGDCETTPYEDAYTAYLSWKKDGNEERAKAFRAAAQAEVDFLKSLRETPNE